MLITLLQSIADLKKYNIKQLQPRRQSVGRKAAGLSGGQTDNGLRFFCTAGFSECYEDSKGAQSIGSVKQMYGLMAGFQK